MRCDKINQLLSQFVDGDLTPKTSAAVQEHVLGCQACQRRLEAMKQCVEALENVQPQNEKVDMLPDFKQRLASPKKRRLPDFMPGRKLVFAFGAAVLLIIALIPMINRHGGYTGPNRIYVSEPRQPGSPAYGFLAVAEADEISQAAFSGDSRMSQKVDVHANGEPMYRVVDMLSRRTGVKLTVADDACDGNVILHLNDMELRQVLVEIARAFDLDWRAVGDGGKREYILFRSDRSKKLEKMALGSARADLLRTAEDLLRRAVTAVEERDPTIVDGTGLQGEVNTAINTLQTGKPCGPMNCYMIYLNQDAVDQIVSGGTYILRYGDMSELQRKGIEREHLFNGKIIPANPDHELKIELKITDAGTAELSYERQYNWSTSKGSSTLLTPRQMTGMQTGSWPKPEDRIFWGGRVSLYPDSSGNMVVRADPKPSEEEKVKAAEKQGETPYPELRRELQNAGGEYDLPGLAQLIHQKMGIDISGDWYFSRLEKHYLPGNLTIGQALTAMTHMYDVSWSYDRNAKIIRFRHKAWMLLKAHEVPAWAIERLENAVKTKGTFDVDDLAAVSRFNGYQLSVLDDLVTNKYASDGWYGYISHNVGNSLHMFRLYNALTPEQKRQVWSPSGVVLPSMSMEQYYEVIRSVVHSEEDLYRSTVPQMRLYATIAHLPAGVGDNVDYNKIVRKSFHTTDSFSGSYPGCKDKNKPRDMLILSISRGGGSSSYHVIELIKFKKQPK